MTRPISLLIKAFLLLFLASAAAFAQANYATLTGLVTDPHHLILPAARITLTSRATGTIRQTTSDRSGLYRLEALQPGPYQLQVVSPGFSAASRELTLEIGPTNLDVLLTLGQAIENMDVSTSPELLKTTDSSIGEVVDQRSVSQLPLNGRMLIDLVLTVPGAHQGFGAQTGTTNPLYWRPGQPSAVSISGNRPNANYFLLDGASNTDPTFNTQNFSASPDAVMEFQVETGSYSAEMGGAGGGQVNIITRSGTSSLHGTAYEFLRNGAMDAHSFNQMGGTNHLVQNNFGASLGGPLSHHTFFFLNYEGFRLAQADSMTDTVPTALEVSGDFSQSGVNVYDPATTRPNPAYNASLPVSSSNPQILRDPFPGNRIPASRLPASSPAAIMLSMYTPRPNVMGMGTGATMMGTPTVVGAGNDSNNFLDVRNELHLNNQGTVRLDHDFANGDNTYLRYSAGGEQGFMPENLPGFGYNHDNLSQQGTLGFTHTFSPRVIALTTLAISRLSMDHTTESANKNDIVTQLGIQGIGFGGPGAWGAPYFAIQGFSPLGDSFAATPMHSWDTIVEGRQTLAWQRGRHQLKFGVSYQRFIWPMWGFFQNRGFYQYTNGFTTATGTNDGTGSALASFLLGLPVVRQRQAGVPQMNLRQWYADSFAQDTFRLSASTTLDFGLRYEYMSPLVDRDFTNTNLVFSSVLPAGNTSGAPGTPSIFIGGQNGFPSGLVYTNRTDLAPRFGIAQNIPHIGLVLHAAYGIFFTPIDMNTWCNQRHNIPYVFPETNQSDNFQPAFNTLNFAPAVLGKTVVSFTGTDLHPSPQYLQQWSASVEKLLGKATTVEIGYLGSGGFHLQRAHLINNALPGPGALQPRRPFQKISFVPDSVLPANVTVLSTTTPVSAINLLENSAQSWYDAGYINVRRRFVYGLSFLANYTFAKSLTNAPDFRSPMDESTIPQNNNDLAAEKGLACDIRQRVSISAVYGIPAWQRSRLTTAATRNWQLSSIAQFQSGYPMTISVFGDTANAGTALGENPIRANLTGKPIFGSGTRNASTWFNPAAFSTPPAYTFGNSGRNAVEGPGLGTVDMAVVRAFDLTERLRFETRGEFFNALNHTNLGDPNRFVNTAGFGSITSVSTPGREIQLSARLSF